MNYHLELNLMHVTEIHHTQVIHISIYTVFYQRVYKFFSIHVHTREKSIKYSKDEKQ